MGYNRLSKDGLQVACAVLRMPAGAPTDLVQIVTGFAESGAALVSGGVDKLIFVGSTEVQPPGGFQTICELLLTLTPASERHSGIQ